MRFNPLVSFVLPALAATLTLFSGTAKAVTLRPIGTYNPRLGEGASEITAYDATSQRLFVTNAVTSTIDILNISNPSTPTLIKQVGISAYGTDLNYVSSKHGLLAVALDGASAQQPGSVVFFNSNGDFLRQITVGPRPDMLTFSPDGSKVVVGNEGTPSADYQIDPEGSVSIIHLLKGSAGNGLELATVTTANFRKFNGTALDPSLRIFGPGASVAQDLEPENVAISPDGTQAFVSLQENNGIAVVDLEAGEISRVFGAGFKDFSRSGLDASDRDDGVNITTYANLFGLYQPDAIAAYEVNGQTYIVTANEGDARVYPDGDTDTLAEGEAFNEEARVADLTLDPDAFPADAAAEDKLGRLKVTNTLGDRDGDGDFDALYAFGGRSFSIYTSQGQQVFDSGDDFERILAQQAPDLFNVDISAEAGVETERAVDSRSDDKGPEPEGVSIATLGDRVYAFISLERSNGVFTYDITDPAKAKFESFIAVAPGDISPEGNLFISAQDSPNGKPLVVLSNETSGTTTLYEVTGLPDTTSIPEPVSSKVLMGLAALSSLGILRRSLRH